MIYLNYLCDDEQKSNINLILKDNEKKYQQELREKYNPDNVFKIDEEKIKIEKNEVTDDLDMVEYKENIFKKIISFVKEVFHKKA